MNESTNPLIEAAPQPEGDVRFNLTSDEERDVDIKMNQMGMSSFEAEYWIIGLERACLRKGITLEEGKAMLKLPEEETDASKGNSQTSYPEGPVYKPHPKGVGPRQRTIGDAGKFKAAAQYDGDYK